MKPDNGIDNAPSEVKLAIDLIMLLEQNEVDSHQALAAIKLVEQDLKRKINAAHTTITTHTSPADNA